MTSALADARRDFLDALELAGLNRAECAKRFEGPFATPHALIHAMCLLMDEVEALPQHRAAAQLGVFALRVHGESNRHRREQRRRKPPL